MRLLKNISNILRMHEPSVNRGMKSVPRRGVARDLSHALTAGAGNSFNFKLTSFNFPIAIAIAFVLSLTSCIGERLDDCPDMPGTGQLPGVGSKDNQVYIELNLTFPSESATRSETEDDGESSDGRFDAYDFETLINHLRLVMTWETTPADGGAPQQEMISLAAKDQSISLPVNGGIKKISVPISGDQLESLIGKSVKLYLVANVDGKAGFNNDETLPTTFDALTETMPHWDNWMPIPVTTGRFPIINAKECSATFTGISAQDVALFKAGSVKDAEGNVISGYTTFEDLVNKIQKNLSSVFGNTNVLELERAFARFDFSDKSPEGDGIYPILYAYEDEEDEDAVCPLSVKMQSITLINVKTSDDYMFRHTAAGTPDGINYTKGTTAFNITYADGEPQLFNVENNDATGDTYRWIVDPLAGYKIWKADEWTQSNDGYAGYFFNRPNKTSTDEDAVISSANAIAGWNVNLFVHYKNIFGNDNYQYKYQDGNQTWYALKYMAENTFPTTKSMIRGLTTGLAFQVLLCDSEGNKIPKITSASDLLDEDENPLYGGWITYNEPANGETEGSITVTVLDESVNLKWESNIGPDGNNKTEDGYYLTYYYFFRHNNNNDVNVTGPMEFGVVRNNIYRVSVTGFNGLPVPFDPEDPDEIPDDYSIAVNLKVLAWAKRDISVTF